jgi:hypothetical protein
METEANVGRQAPGRTPPQAQVGGAKRVFVVMPFSAAPGRSKEVLTEFFQAHIKEPIEHASGLRYSYEVFRSGNDFMITEQIISDLFRANIVVCDVSGDPPNPNVMYELGIRLSVSSGPVILIRQQQEKQTFDIRGLHVHEYDPLMPRSVDVYLLSKLRAFENGQEEFRSPVLETLERGLGFVRIGKSRAQTLLNVLEVGLISHLNSLRDALNLSLQGSGLFLEANPGLDPLALAKELIDKGQHLQSLDWSSLKLAAGPHPSIAYYLSTLYLSDIVESELEVSFSVAMLRLYERYFTNLAWWFHFDLERLGGFSVYVGLLIRCCKLLVGLLRDDEGSNSYIERRTELLGILKKF